MVTMKVVVVVLTIHAGGIGGVAMSVNLGVLVPDMVEMDVTAIAAQRPQQDPGQRRYDQSDRHGQGNKGSDTPTRHGPMLEAAAGQRNTAVRAYRAWVRSRGRS